MLTELALGVVLAAATVAVARQLRPESERLLFAVLLPAAAAVYAGGALAEGGRLPLTVSTAGFLVFLVLAMAGFRSAKLLGLAWLLHAGWDLLHFLAVLPDTGVAHWYEIVCFAADGVWGGFLLVRRGPE